MARATHSAKSGRAWKALEGIAENNTKATLALVLVVLTGVILSFQWHALASKTPVLSMQLNEYDFLVQGSDSACFKLELQNSLKKEALGELVVEVEKDGSKLEVLREPFKVPFNGTTKEYCVEPSSLGLGNNLVKASFSNRTVFFNVAKDAQARNASEPAGFALKRIGAEGSKVYFQVTSNSRKGTAKQVSIKVNGQEHHSFLAYLEPGKTRDYAESLDLGNGKNEVTASIDNHSVLFEVTAGKPFKVPREVGVVAVMALLAGFASLKKTGRLEERLAKGLAIMAAALIVLPMIANYSGVRLEALTVAPMVFGFWFVAFLMEKRKNAKDGKEKLGEGKENALFLAALALLVLFSSAAQLFLQSNYTFFNNFYERQSSLILEQNKIPQTDPLSYLGRGYSFNHGYFLFESSLGFISGLEGTQLFALALLVTNAFFVSAIYFLGKTLGFNNKENALLALFVTASNFTFWTFTLSPKQTLALALFMTSIAVVLSKRKPAGAALAGVAGFTQFSMVFAFPVMAYALSEKKERLGFWVKTAGIALLSFAALYSTIFFQFGPPNEVYSDEWGYLITLPLWRTVADAGGFLGVMALLAMALGIRKWRALDYYRKKLIAFTVAALAAQTIVSYRVNVFTSIIAGVLALKFFQKELKGKWFNAALLLGLAGFAYLATNSLGVGVLNYSFTESVSFISQNSSTQSKLLVEPLYGHITTFLGKRKVLADLYVEFAEAEKLEDEYDYVLNANKEVLSKWGINHVFVNNKLTTVGAGNTREFGGKRELKDLDLVYTNGELDFYLVRENA